MTQDATLHDDVRKLLHAIDALLTHGSGKANDPVREMVDDLSAIRNGIDECAIALKAAVVALQDSSASAHLD